MKNRVEWWDERQIHTHTERKSSKLSDRQVLNLCAHTQHTHSDALNGNMKLTVAMNRIVLHISRFKFHIGILLLPRKRLTLDNFEKFLIVKIPSKWGKFSKTQTDRERKRDSCRSFRHSLWICNTFLLSTNISIYLIKTIWLIHLANWLLGHDVVRHLCVGCMPHSRWIEWIVGFFLEI